MSNVDKARVQIVAGLIRNGIPEAEARNSTDVALHAAVEAAETVKRICEPLHGREWTNAYAVAIQASLQIFESMLQEMQDKASELGMRADTFAVDTRS